MNERLGRSFWQWIVLLLVTFLCLYLQRNAQWLSAYPAEWVVPFTPVMNAAMNFTVDHVGWFFRAVSDGLQVPLRAIQAALQWLP